MKTRLLLAWAISFVLGTVVTYILFEFTPIAIPFFEGSFYTVLSVLLMTFAFSYVIDAVMKAGLYDEHGWHTGLFDPMGPIARDEPPPPDDYEPIVSREERQKQRSNA